ncbi:MAG: histidine phosphatase family protein [Clostridia bacterium]|nr:histidine phosphatase family protein [Clostridia bacterium]
MRILIIRHGDPDYERDTLTEKGHREAKLLADRYGKEKIDYFYSSPLGRAKHTCDYVAKAHGKENDIVIKDWLQEFGAPHTLPTGEFKHIIWDLLPEFWTKIDKMYDRSEWLDQDFYKVAKMDKRYQEVVDGLDEVLKNHGYVRKDGYYEVKEGNCDTIAFFCHFGLEMMLLSHLCNISPIVLTHHFVALPTSVTTLYTEERREGIATFRCCGFGDTGHLYAGGEPCSKSARFCEVYGNDERHD